jgi:hypothetical protein
MSVIPLPLPEAYISDPHLMSFLELLVRGLSKMRIFRPKIDNFQKHEFMKVQGGIATAIDEDEREYLEIVESIVCGNFFRRERVKREVNAKRGYQLPPHM